MQQLGFWGDVKKGFNKVTDVVNKAAPLTVAGCQMLGYDSSVCDSIKQGAQIYNTGAQVINSFNQQQ
jgi:hypothetical protein